MRQLHQGRKPPESRACILQDNNRRSNGDNGKPPEHPTASLAARVPKGLLLLVLPLPGLENVATSGCGSEFGGARLTGPSTELLHRPSLLRASRRWIVLSSRRWSSAEGQYCVCSRETRIWRHSRSSQRVGDNAFHSPRFGIHSLLRGRRHSNQQEHSGR